MRVIEFVSAILGVYHFDSRNVDETILAGMATSMAHRGPDNSDLWQNDFVGLGQCMLHSTLESLHEHLPFEDRESSLVITADARIDNREELSSRLGLNGRLKNNIPDSQLILAAYKKWERDCVSYLLGDFAFAIWDQRRRQLFCARDHMGIRPFYYHFSSNLFVFASEVRAVLCEPRVPRHINDARIADFLVIQLEGIDQTSTFYEKIFRLPPAHTMVVTAGKVSINNYWELDSKYESRFKSDEEYEEAFREVYTKAIHCRLRSHTPPASMLSGGIDSSSIVGIAREFLKNTDHGPLQIYAGISEEGTACRETRYIQKVIDYGGLQPCVIQPSGLNGYREEMEEVFRMLGEPFDASMTMIIAIYIAARENGNRVVLDGVDGDLVVSLSPSYPAYLLRLGHWKTATQEIVGQRTNYYQDMLPLWRIWLSNLRAAMIPRFVRRLRGQLLVQRRARNAMRRTIISPEFARKIKLEARLATMAIRACNGLCPTMREQQVRSLMHTYLTVGVERYDRVAALCSVEPRHPLLDKRVVEFCVSLPWNQKVRNGWSKYIVRKTAEKTLPLDVCWRKGWEQIGWIFTSAWMKLFDAEINSYLLTNGRHVQEFVNPKFLNCNLQEKMLGTVVDSDYRKWCLFYLTTWYCRSLLKDHPQGE